MIDAGDFKKLIENADGAGWAFFEQAQKQMAAAMGGVEAADANSKQTADGREICAAWRAFANSPGGAKALQSLCDRTVNRGVFITHLGYSAEQVAIFGAHREGGNEIVWSILKMIAQGEADEKQPKPREAENAG